MTGWQWGRPVQDWEDAEQLAAAHMVSLGLRQVLITPRGTDGGLDVVSETAAAQVKFTAVPTGSPDIQRLYGAAEGFSGRLFYSVSYSPPALAMAERLGVASFQYDPAGAVASVNAAAREVGRVPTEQPLRRGPFGTLTLESRQVRALRWAEEVQAAAERPISNRKRKGARQLAARQEALSLVVTGLSQVEASGSPLYKQRRRERTIAEAEKSLKTAASMLGIQVR